MTTMQFRSLYTKNKKNHHHHHHNQQPNKKTMKPRKWGLSSQQGYANNTTNTNLNLWNKMCLATDLLHATLPLGGFSPSFPPLQKPSPGLLVPPCAEGV
jgi:hypothetical protein